MPPVGLCVSLLRTQSAEEAAELVESLIEWRHPRIVALSIDGNEAAAERTGPHFATAFARAGQAGLKRTVHAGESSGPEGVRDAIELLDADRIDRGVRAIEDERVVALLVEKQVTPGVCPTSNIALGVFSSLSEHIRAMNLGRLGSNRRVLGFSRQKARPQSYSRSRAT